MITNLILSISSGLIFLTVLWIFFLIKHIHKEVKLSERDCKSFALTCTIAVDSIEEITKENEVYFKKLADKYRLKLYSAINQYIQSRKEKNRKFSYKSKMNNNSTRNKKPRYQGGN